MSEKGPLATEKGTKWGPRKRIFDKLTKTCSFIEVKIFSSTYTPSGLSFSAQCVWDS